MIEPERIFLAKAHESLAGADSELRGRRFNNCANRAYYACFQAAIHALTREGVHLPAGRDRWRHEFVQAQFAGLLVNRRKIYPAHFRDTLLRVLAVRQAADYGHELVGERQAQRAYQRASELVGAVASRDAELP